MQYIEKIENSTQDQIRFLLKKYLELEIIDIEEKEKIESKTQSKGEMDNIELQNFQHIHDNKIETQTNNHENDLTHKKYEIDSQSEQSQQHLFRNLEQNSQKDSNSSNIDSQINNNVSIKDLNLIQEQEKIEAKSEKQEDGVKSEDNNDDERSFWKTKKRDYDPGYDSIIKIPKFEQEEVKIQNIPKSWFEQESAVMDKYHKWDYLEHHGVIFPEPYQVKNLVITYRKVIDGQSEFFEITLPPQQEELAWYWCQTIGTQWEENEIYKNNFKKQFLQRFKKLGFNKFQNFDFTNVIKEMEKSKQQRKNASIKEKQARKKQKAQLLKNYSLAIVDDLIEKISCPIIEPSTLFKGRGKHPKAGTLKPRIMPQDITLNLSEDAPIPKCSIPGHSWKQIISNRSSTWLCHYFNDTVGVTNANKYIMLAQSSKLKGINDMKKYDKARKLKQEIGSIRKDYTQKIYSKNIVDMELGTAVYLIDMLALRVGNQKGDDEADTVGCCSLRVQHVEILENNQIKLDFLGKDSMRYQNTVEVDSQVWQNFKVFTHKKRPEFHLFSHIDPAYLNEYLKSLMKGLTAKVFRTYNASITLQEQLNATKFEGLTMDQKLQKYQQANREVAILCNHQRTVGKKFIESLSKKQIQINIYKAYLKELEEHKLKFSTLNVGRLPALQKIVQYEDGTKQIIKRFPQSRDATVKMIQKIQLKIERQSLSLQRRDEGKSIALSTSKTNYNDPRITVAWCKKHEVKIQKVFTKNLIGKFIWAMHIDSSWQF